MKQEFELVIYKDNKGLHDKISKPIRSTIMLFFKSKKYAIDEYYRSCNDSNTIYCILYRHYGFDECELLRCYGRS